MSIIISPPFGGTNPGDDVADFIRAQFAAWKSTDPKLDKITNTVYFRRNLGVDMESPDWDALAGDILTAFNVNGIVHYRGTDRQQVKLYDMEDAEPRQPKAVASSSQDNGDHGTREVALCLSFRGESNVPRQRGRIFIGPFQQAQLLARPSAALRDQVISLADRLAGIGGLDIDWCVHSPRTIAAGGSLGESFKPVRHSWVDDEWDTQRSRGLPSTTRTVKTHNG